MRKFLEKTKKEKNELMIFFILLPKAKAKANNEERYENFQILAKKTLIITLLP